MDVINYPDKKGDIIEIYEVAGHVVYYKNITRSFSDYFNLHSFMANHLKQITEIY